jgi:hypothetical protein
LKSETKILGLAFSLLVIAMFYSSLPGFENVSGSVVGQINPASMFSPGAVSKEIRDSTKFY